MADCDRILGRFAGSGNMNSQIRVSDGKPVVFTFTGFPGNPAQQGVDKRIVLPLLLGVSENLIRRCCIRGRLDRGLEYAADDDH